MTIVEFTNAALPIGPGILTLGEVGSGGEFGCAVTTGTINPDKDKDDDIDVLDGQTEAGAARYTASLSFTTLQRPRLVAWLYQHKGEQMPARFVPTKIKGGLEFNGTVTIDPVTVGGDVKTKATSDVELDFVGFPTLTPYDPDADLGELPPGDGGTGTGDGDGDEDGDEEPTG